MSIERRAADLRKAARSPCVAREPSRLARGGAEPQEAGGVATQDVGLGLLAQKVRGADRLRGLPAVQRSERTLWRARFAAQSGRTGDAVALLRGSFAQGLSHGLWLHTDADLAVLRGERDFEALLSARVQPSLASGS